MTRAHRAPHPKLPASAGGDRSCPEVALAPQRLASGFRHYDRFTVTLSSGQKDVRSFERELLRSGPVVGILPVDLQRHEIVLVRQFRLGGHLATGLGEMVEIPAGRVDAGETAENAARRECLEEIGVRPARLVALFGFAPAPALTDEFMHLFLAQIDAVSVPPRAGLAHEAEEIATIRYPIGEVAGMLSANCLHSAPTLVALQWLTANQATLAHRLR
jgi:ADP-ribose pyrophosphatase